MVKISVVYSVNKSLALYSIYSLCYLQTKSLRTSSPRKKNIVLTSWHFRSFSNYFRIRWVTSEYIDPKVCVLLLTWHAWNTVLNKNLIDYEWNEIYYFELSQRHVNQPPCLSLLSMFVYPKNAFDRWRIDAVPSYFRSPRVRLLSIYCLMYSKDWIFFWWIKYSWKRKLMLIPRSYPLSVTISSMFF